MSQGWIAVDLDGTLAHYEGWRGPQHIGEPILPMLTRVSLWLDAGKDVRIFTARVSSDGSPERDREVNVAQIAIRAWCLHHIGVILPITCCKDFGMIELWDDRCVQVETNTGILVRTSL